MLKIGDIEYAPLKGKVSDEEWEARVQLAALCRLIPMMGWDDLSNQLVGSRAGDHFLFTPKGVLFEEITASSLLKVDIQGRIVADTPFEIVPNIWHPLRAVFEARLDAQTVIHTHDDYLAAVAAHVDGLLPISQSAAFALATGISYHAYDGTETYEQRIPGLQASLGGVNYSMILRNHGLLTLGPTTGSAFMIHYIVRKACRVQVMSGVQSGAAVSRVSDELLQTFPAELMRAAMGDGSNDAWPGLLRKLERQDPGFRD